ncbi:hypothetical protein BOTBODRAFT_189275 [Botryobasidium botryosum FD-172 SS1]|uniref:Uncharacterized protein n=1 Tax=Botryobasidium botryosum (strain FD-172 SS1) TaxID=930990 RepID=A0A067MK69_BOTB1|nr:hypothetical protein BOTBODRAFT_189275 [Botryobasidium botryosum FD-172 SS1]
MNGDAASRPHKRARKSKKSKASTSGGIVEKVVHKTAPPQRLFAPFRALGFVTNHVPLVLQTWSSKGSAESPRIEILTCLGKAWAMWEGGKMGLLFVGSNTEHHISSLAFEGHHVWAATGDCVIKYVRGKETSRVTNPLGSAISKIITFGSQLLALTEDGRRLLVWDVSTGELSATILFDNGFTATQVLHPATYLNKVLVASAEGGLQLWNIRTQTCIYTFDSPRLQDSASGPCAITTLVQSPAIDVVGIGFSSGEVSVYDIRADERLMRMHMDGGGIRAIGFRSDGHPVLATASASGNLALWDLNEGGRLLHLARGAHDGAITAVEWIPGQPLLITSGEDNSVKQWLFDSPTAPPRLLKYRSGHHSPPHFIRYYGDDGKQLLTAARDRSLRCTSVVRDSRSFELSQGSLTKKATALSVPLAHLKFPPITALSFSSARSKDWEDVLTAHMDETISRTWTVQNKKVGRWSLGVPLKEKSRAAPGVVKAVCVTACGNFGVSSTTTGSIRMWNMQSGIQRKTFDVGPVPLSLKHGTFATKERSVTGLATDALNRVLIASTLDGTLNFFDFHSTKLDHVLILPSPAVQIVLQRDSGLLAVLCDDLCVRIVDIETQRIVREMNGFRGRILDVAFSPDSRWLITTSLDSIIRTFDIPSGRLIDAFKTTSVAASIAFSPTGDFLATAHVDSVGVYLWANKAQYSEVSLQTVVDDDVTDTVMPSIQGLSDDDVIEGLSEMQLGDSRGVYTTPDQLDGELVTLTLLPRSRWQTLLNLETIHLRNKPKEPPKAPEKAPFFLPTLPGTAPDPKFDLSSKGSASHQKSKSRRMVDGVAQVESEFYKKLVEDDVDGEFESFFSYMKSLSPAAIDAAMHSLPTLPSAPQPPLALFLGALTQRLRAHRDFEAVQTFISVFLRIHGEALVGESDEDAEEVRRRMVVLREVQKAESSRVMELIQASLGTLAFVRDTL